MPVTTGEIWTRLDRPSRTCLGGRLHRRPHPALLGRHPGGARRRPDHRRLRQAAQRASRQAHRDRRIRLAERRLQHAARQSRAASSRRTVLRDFVSRAEALRHRLQHHRSVRPAVEDVRRQRRRLLGHVRRLAPAEVRLDRRRSPTPTTGSSRRSRSLLGAAAVAADPGTRRGDRRRGRHCSRSPPMRSAPGSRPCSRSGTATISCRAPPSRSGLGVVLLVPLVVIALGAHRGNRRRSRSAAGRAACCTAPPLRRPEGFAPKVSIHIPAYREPPEMLKATLDAVARLDYPNFECVVVINNTPDPAFWRPVEEHCRDARRALQVHQRRQARGLQGRRAARSRSRTPRPTPRSSASSTPTMSCVRTGSRISCRSSPIRKVGLIQAPQDHRDGDRSVMHHAMNGEYAGFFDIGMVQRNEANAIIVHGTMCLIRRAALDRRRRLVERHHLRGHRSRPDHARARLAGRTTPTGATATACCPTPSRPSRSSAIAGPMAACRSSRSIGAACCPARAGLTREQKREFALGWLNWLGAESARRRGRDPQPALGAGRRRSSASPSPTRSSPCRSSPPSWCRSLHFVALYRLRVAIPPARLLGARVRRHVGAVDGGARGRLRPDQGSACPSCAPPRAARARKGRDFPAFWEGVIGGAAADRRAIVVMPPTTSRSARSTSSRCVLVVQSLPFLAAAALAALEGSRFNEFAYLARRSRRKRRRAAAAAAPPACRRRRSRRREAVETAQ